MNQPFRKPVKVYGVKLKDKEKLMESQSGGAFTALAEYFLEMGGIVYGCGMNAEHMAEYKRIVSKDGLKEIKGSKYVQAEPGDIFRNVKKDLEDGKTVLFSGTPCYAAAMKAFAENIKNNDRLYTVDLICHGVPSPLIYRSYLKELEEKMRSRITAFIFRDKNSGGGGKNIWKR